MTLEIRPLKISDLPFFVELCELHAMYEKTEYHQEGKVEMLKQQMTLNSDLKILVAEMKGELIGYCSLIKQFSTWDAEFYLYLDCLFVKDGFRGHRIGGKLMARAKQYAIENNCKEIQWQTPDFNEGAIRFYKRLGAISKTKERFFWVM